MKATIANNSNYFKEIFVDLIYTNDKFQDIEFENCRFEKCRFTECIFDNCRFIDCIFIACSISAAKPFNSKFDSVLFKDSKVMGFDWTKSRSVNTVSFENCDLSYSNFSFMKLPNLSLLKCIAKEVNFNEADLTGSIFTETDFLETVFSHTNLTKADFRKAINYGIDFNFNVLKKAKFSLPEATSLLRSLDIELEG